METVKPVLKRSKSMHSSTASNSVHGHNNHNNDIAAKTNKFKKDKIEGITSSHESQQNVLQRLKTGPAHTTGRGSSKSPQTSVPQIRRRHSSREFDLERRKEVVRQQSSVESSSKMTIRNPRKDENLMGPNLKIEKKNSGDATVAAAPHAKQVGRSSFLSVTQRVSSLLKVRRAMMPKSGLLAGEKIKEEEVISPTEIVASLPVTPRFSSYMSAEAQFALMKGYEDLLHEKLTTEHPEYGQAIMRTKTPHQNIAISDTPGAVDVALRESWRQQDLHRKDARAKKSLLAREEASNGKPDNTKEADIEQKSRENHDERSAINCNKAIDNAASGNSTADQDGSNKNIPTDTNDITSTDDNSKDAFDARKISLPITSSKREERALSPLQNLRRMSLAFPAKQDNGDTTMTSSNDTRTKNSMSPRRSMTSLGSEGTIRKPLPHSRRIVMSYRLESAMDLLDTIKPSSEHALSPRVKVKDTKSRSRQLVDFKRWTEQWATEFKTDKVN